MRKVKKFSQGGRAEAARDRRMADIEKDYQRAIAKGKSEKEAKAKRDQRIADARDDYAKRTGGDRTETRAAEKAAEARLSAARRGAGKDMKPVSVLSGGDKSLAAKADMPKVDTPKIGEDKPKAGGYDSMSFSAAFRQAMKDKGPGETFTYRGTPIKLEYASGKKSPNTAPSADRAERPTAARGTGAGAGAGASSSARGSGTTASTRPNPLAQYERERTRREGTTGSGITVTASRAQVEAAKAAARKKAAAFLAEQQRAARDAAVRRGQRPATFGRPTDAQLDRIADQQGFNKGGKVKKYAKGGKIDGIAIRGKTRLKRKK